MSIYGFSTSNSGTLSNISFILERTMQWEICSIGSSSLRKAVSMKDIPPEPKKQIYVLETQNGKY